MTDPSATTASTAGAAAPNRGVKRGLPTAGIPTAEESANKLWAMARRGTTSKEAFARQLGWSKVSGNHWDTRIALMRGFKLIRMEGDQIGLSDIGLQLVNESNPERQIEARQAAVMNLKAYNELVADFDGTELPDVSALSSRLRYDYGKAEDFAAKAAKAFVDSLVSARMLDESKTVHKNGIGLERQIPATDVPISTPDFDEDENDAELDRAFDEQEVGEQAISDTESPPPTEPLAIVPNMSVAISVNLDLSKYRPDEVIEILRALGVSKYA